MHCQGKAWVHAHQYIAEDKFAVTVNTDPHDGFVPDAVTQRIDRGHVDVTQGANNTAVQFHAAVRSFQCAARSIFDIAALADGWMHAEFELFGHRNFDLSDLACWTEHANAFDAAFGTDDGELLFAGVLAGLRQIRVFGQLMALAEQRLDMFLREVNVMR